MNTISFTVLEKFSNATESCLMDVSLDVDATDTLFLNDRDRTLFFAAVSLNSVDLVTRQQ